jgi:DNA-binding CsgD family transcriptional regulator
MLYGRGAEQEVIDRLLRNAAEGVSGVLVIRGEPGIGKTALLNYAQAPRMLRGSGVEFEAELPFAGLNLLLRPALGHLPDLPEPQRAALESAFGLAPGTPHDRLLVGLAVLSLLAEYADGGPLLCVVDDAHWLDRASAEALVFAARRLQAEGVALIFATRDGDGMFPAPGLPELRLTGIGPADAAALLGDDLDPAVRFRVLAEAQGNPLALTELPAAFAGAAGVGALGALPLSNRLQVAFHGQVSGLPGTTQALLLVAAADDTGDLAIVLRAAKTLGADVRDLLPAEEVRLIDVTGQTVTFRHPLVRAAVYQRAPLGQRLAAHQALAGVLTAPKDADRRAWHRAAATTGADEQVADELENTAVRASERSGFAAASAAYERAAGLSELPADQARRLTLAAEFGVEAGELARAVDLAERAATLEKDPHLLARIAHVEALAWFWQGGIIIAHELLIKGAELADPDRATRMLVQAFHTAWYLGGPAIGDVLARLETVTQTPASTALIAAIRGRPVPLPTEGEPRELVQSCGAGLVTGQDREVYALATALTAKVRAQGGIGLLPTLLFFLAEAELFHGRHQDAVVSADEALRIARDTGQRQWISQVSAVHALLAALKGDEARCRSLVEESLGQAGIGSDAAGQPWTLWALALLDLGHGRAEAALARLIELNEGQYGHQVCAIRSIPDLVEAAVRLGAPERATVAYTKFEAWVTRVEQPWAEALLLRCKALLAPDTAAEEHYLAALSLNGRPFEHARTVLLYGEWLRRARRKADARIQLRLALEVLERLDAAPWVARTRAELEATGEISPQAVERLATRLTPQELQICRLAGRGLSNKDIAAQLFLSPRTVGYHLYKAYPKLGIVSRGELAALDL